MKREKKLDNFYQDMGKMMEELYANMSRAQRDDYLHQLDEYVNRVESVLNQVIKFYEGDKILGKTTIEQKKRFKILENDLKKLRKEMDNKFKIYIRGCGKAGKSTLLNALLEVDQEKGSEMDLKPMTFTIDTYTDELGLEEAIIRRVDENGNTVEERMSRERAKIITKKERDQYNQSEDECRRLISQATANLTIDTEIEDVKKQIIGQHLMKSDIRETIWGIGKNEFLKNCLIVDTPGLGQELDSENRIKVIKEYEMDGILWVVSTDGLNRQETVEEYEKEMKKYAELYSNQKLIGVVNIMNHVADDEDVKYQKIMKQAKRLFGDRVTDIVCVNNQLAYEGVVEKNPEKIRKSNIEELKAKINLRFAEKSSDETIERHAGRIRSFCVGFEETIKEDIVEMEKVIEEYDEISNRLAEQKNACFVEFNSKRDKIKTNYKSLLRERAKAHEEEVQKNFLAQDENPEDWIRFIREKIIVDDGLQRDLAEVRGSMDDSVYRRFYMLQRGCVISQYKTPDFAFKDFVNNRKEKFDITVLRESSVAEFRTDWNPKGLAYDIENLAGSIFGREVGDFVGGIIKGLKKMFTNPQNEVKRQIDKYVDRVGDSFDIRELVDYYNKPCRDILNRSMLEYMGPADDIRKLLQELNGIKDTDLEWKLKEITFYDMLTEG